MSEDQPKPKKVNTTAAPGELRATMIHRRGAKTLQGNPVVPDEADRTEHE